MISKRYLEGRKVFGNDPWDIEIADADMTFIEMLHSPEMYIPHHVLEWKYTYNELNEMNRYKKVSSEELIWVKQSVHNGNAILHKDFFKFTTEAAYKEKMRKAMKGNTNGSGGKGKKLSEETKKKLSEAHKKRPGQNRAITEFGNKYFEHYGYGYSENPSQYNKEKYYHKCNNKFSWED